MVCIGRTKVAWLPRLSEPPVLTVDDFNDPGAANISFWLMNGFGLVFDGEWRIEGLHYITDPQHPGAGIDPLLEPRRKGYFALRYGPQVTTDWSPIQLANLVPVELGARRLGRSHEDDYAKWVHKQECEVIGAPLFGVEIGAGREVEAVRTSEFSPAGVLVAPDAHI
jgi:hypothetical protein